MLQLLIRESFENCSLDELAPETINLLRASLQLHPILTGARKDLGHPDELGGWYAILESFIFPTSMDHSEAFPSLRQEYKHATACLKMAKVKTRSKACGH